MARVMYTVGGNVYGGYVYRIGQADWSVGALRPLVGRQENKVITCEGG